MMSGFIQGTYIVKFESNVGRNGFGMINLNGGSISGGDLGYRYRGRVQATGGIIRGIVDIRRIDPDAESIFGPIEFFKLVISGRAVGQSYQFSGHVLGWEHLRVRFRLISVNAIAAE